MPAKPVKSSKSAKSSKSVKAAPRTRSTTSKTRVVTSRSAKLPSLQSRYKFVATCVVIAAALVAVSLGFLSHSKQSSDTNAAADTAAHGAMFLQSVDTTKVEPGATVNVAVYENSGNDPVNAVQAAVNYPADKLEIVSVKTGEAFPQEAATDTATTGLVRLARSIRAQSAPVRGAKPIATLEFKVTQPTTSPIELSVDRSTSLLVRSTDNQNILEPSGSAIFELGK